MGVAVARNSYVRAAQPTATSLCIFSKCLPRIFWRRLARRSPIHVYSFCSVTRPRKLRNQSSGIRVPRAECQASQNRLVPTGQPLYQIGTPTTAKCSRPSFVTVLLAPLRTELSLPPTKPTSIRTPNFAGCSTRVVTTAAFRFKFTRTASVAALELFMCDTSARAMWPTDGLQLVASRLLGVHQRAGCRL